MTDVFWHDSNGNIVDPFDPHGGDGSWAKTKEEASDDEDFQFNAEGYVNGEHQVAKHMIEVACGESAPIFVNNSSAFLVFRASKN